MREAPNIKQNKTQQNNTSPTLSLSLDEGWCVVNETEQGANKKTPFGWLKRILESGEY